MALNGQISLWVLNRMIWRQYLTLEQNDFLAWLMDEAKGYELTTRALVLRLLTLNFAAIHTSSMVGLYLSIYHIDLKFQTHFILSS